jgi:ammonium transporter, Amt family
MNKQKLPFSSVVRVVLIILGVGVIGNAQGQDPTSQNIIDNLQNEKIDRNSKGIDSHENRIQTNERNIQKNTDATKKNSQDIQKNTVNIQKNAEGLAKSEESIQNNLSAIEQNRAQIATTDGLTKQNLEDIKKLDVDKGITKNQLDRFWVVIAAVLVFMMQAGFKAFEVGVVRRRHGDTTGIKNLVDALVVCAVFFLLGFSLMFGKSVGGFIGWGLFAPTSPELEAIAQMPGANHKLGFEFFLFQLAFAATAATIVSGAMAGRTLLLSYAVTSIFVATVIYPTVGHWVWGATYYPGNEPWLHKLGFRDFAGSTVVHSMAAWISLVGIWIVGPRHGRFLEDGSVNRRDFEPYSLGYATLGVFLLWFGWWGFNGGSLLKYDNDVSSIIFNTNISAAFGGLAAYAQGFLRNFAQDHGLPNFRSFLWNFLSRTQTLSQADGPRDYDKWILDRRDMYFKILGGTLGGLVAITACCNVVTSIEAMFIGSIAGLLQIYVADLLLRFKLDDPVAAIPVHGACGVWGTLCVGIFDGAVGVQVLGIIVVFAWTAGLSFLFFKLLSLVGLRMEPMEESLGDRPEPGQLESTSGD